ncbi:MAG TPA: AMP-binding protein [Jatrophihabitantaceae bacterium]|nr:AMP-binding protein [Jatrophihabitantaceae bacterium]
MAAALPFGALVTALAAEQPDAAAVTCGTTSLTRGQLDRRTNQRARRYAGLGVGEGSLVVVQLPNSVELVESVVAVWKLGAVPLVLPPTMPAAERGPILELGSPALVVDTADPPPSDQSDAPLAAVASPYWRASTSGGSTGRPKLIYTNRRAVADPDERTLYLRRDGCIAIPGPLYHGAPFLFMTFGLMRGKHVVLLPKFDPEATLRACAEQRADYLLLVPTMMNRIWKLPPATRDGYDLAALEVMLHLGASCPPQLKRDWIEWLGPRRVHELYAGTEGQAMTWIRGDEWLRHPGSVGRPVGGAQMRALDEQGRELPPGEVGEIFMRAPDGSGPSYRYVGATARTHDGWESLGDLGWVDAEDYVHILDRRSDLILSGGANVYPAEVEAAIEAHPAVRAAVVIGRPDPDLGRRVHAIVESVPGAAIDEAELRRHLADRLVRYKTPRTFEFTNEPLRDEAGKVRRSAVAAARAGDGISTCS